jgi:hypothetical protein
LVAALVRFLSPWEAGARDAQKSCRKFSENVKLARKFICGPLIRLALDFKSVAGAHITGGRRPSSMTAI